MSYLGISLAGFPDSSVTPDAIQQHVKVAAGEAQVPEHSYFSSKLPRKVGCYMVLVD
jgi:hypothetical protein